MADRDRLFDRLRQRSTQPQTRRQLLLGHLDYTWDEMRPRLEGLSDAEYLWEPVRGCWTIHESADGYWTTDWSYPPPHPLPFTTVAWRLAHMSLLCHIRANHFFGDASAGPDTTPIPPTASDALGFLDTCYMDYRHGVTLWTEEMLDQRPDASPPGTIDSEFPRAMNIQHITLELTAHGAEVALLRHLWDAGARS